MFGRDGTFVDVEYNQLQFCNHSIPFCVLGDVHFLNHQQWPQWCNLHDPSYKGKRCCTRAVYQPYGCGMVVVMSHLSHHFQVILLVSSKNTPAQRLYEHMGYQVEFQVMVMMGESMTWVEDGWGQIFFINQNSY